MDQKLSECTSTLSCCQEKKVNKTKSGVVHKTMRDPPALFSVSMSPAEIQRPVLPPFLRKNIH